MNPFDIESDSYFEGLQEIEEGVYFKHYGIEMPYNEEFHVTAEINSFGNSVAKALLWQEQTGINADCIALKSMTEGLLRENSISQEDIEQKCIRNGLFRADCGSSFDDAIDILKMDFSGDKGKNLYVDIIQNGSISELTECVDSDDEAICYVNMMILDSDFDYEWSYLNADGLVHIIGISLSDTDGDCVIINDVSDSNGAGRNIPLERFLKAWSASDYALITVSGR